MSVQMSGLIFGSEEGRNTAAVTHLALARSQNTRNGILGFNKRLIGYRSNACESDKLQKISVSTKDKERSCTVMLQLLFF